MRVYALISTSLDVGGLFIAQLTHDLHVGVNQVGFVDDADQVLAVFLNDGDGLSDKALNFVHCRPN